jgi:hypothetical protein
LIATASFSGTAERLRSGRLATICQRAGHVAPNMAIRRTRARLKACGGKNENAGSCPFPVTCSYVFWPGQRRVFACAEHASCAKRVAAAMGFELVLTREAATE